MASVTIIKAPIGEAPLWVREAWIGLQLSTTDKRPRKYLGLLSLSARYGILSTFFYSITGKTITVPGYRVPSRDAIDLLGKVRPDAAAWWHANAANMMKPNRYFVFDTPACEANAR